MLSSLGLVYLRFPLIEWGRYIFLFISLTNFLTVGGFVLGRFWGIDFSVASDVKYDQAGWMIAVHYIGTRSWILLVGTCWILEKAEKIARATLTLYG